MRRFLYIHLFTSEKTQQVKWEFEGARDFFDGFYGRTPLSGLDQRKIASVYLRQICQLTLRYIRNGTSDAYCLGVIHR
jgi:hypothetical protein